LKTNLAVVLVVVFCGRFSIFGGVNAGAGLGGGFEVGAGGPETGDAGGPPL